MQEFEDFLALEEMFNQVLFLVQYLSLGKLASLLMIKMILKLKLDSRWIVCTKDNWGENRSRPLIGRCQTGSRRGATSKTKGGPWLRYVLKFMLCSSCNFCRHSYAAEAATPVPFVAAALATTDFVRFRKKNTSLLLLSYCWLLLQMLHYDILIAEAFHASAVGTLASYVTGVLAVTVFQVWCWSWVLLEVTGTGASWRWWPLCWHLLVQMLAGDSSWLLPELLVTVDVGWHRSTSWY